MITHSEWRAIVGIDDSYERDAMFYDRRVLFLVSPIEGNSLAQSDRRMVHPISIQAASFLLAAVLGKIGIAALPFGALT